MGNSQTALQGIHPFRDPDEETQQPLPLPPPQSTAPPPLSLPALPPLPPVIPHRLIGFNPVVASPEQQQQEQQVQKPYSEFDELFVVKPPTPPPRRVSADLLPPRRRSIKGFFGGRSLRNLRLSRPDLNKLGSLLRWGKRAGKRAPEVVYPVPPDAEKPSPPSRPEVFQEDDYFLLRWDRPGYDGGLPIIGYIIQHLELGLPQTDPEVEKDDTQCWYSSEPGHVTSTEVMLNNLIPGTTYIFRIIAENLLGYSQPGDTSTPIVFNPHGELDDWFCPPVFVVVLDERYTVLEHERVCLTVEVTGQPYPLVKFYDGSGVELGRNVDPLKYSVTSCGQRRTLTVSSVETSDQGVVRVVAENDKGTAECSCTLVVEAPPRIKRVVRVGGGGGESEEEKSEEVSSDSGVIFQSGELAKFKFVWSASPYPNVCLYHEGDLVFGEEVPGSGHHVSSQRVGVEIADNWILVKIPNVQRSDRGEWTVRLDNVLGEDSASVVLTVTDKPSRPGRPDVLQLSDNTVILKWSEPVDAGGFPIHAYTVEYFRSEWGVWLKACTVKSPFTKIRDLIPGSKYKFRVKAENLYGVGEASDESVELLITDLVSTLRSVGGDDATLLMKTVVEEEEDVETTTTSQQQQQSSTRLDDEMEESGMRPTPPKRKLDLRGSTSSLKVTSATMTEPTITTSPPEQQAASLLRVSLHPQVVVLDEPEETLQPPELQPRHRRSPSPMTHRSSIIIEESEPNSREKSPAGPSTPPPSPPPVPSPRYHKGASPTISSVKTQLPDPLIDSQPKKLYSRAEIIRSAAAEDLAYFLSLSSGGADGGGGGVEDDVGVEEVEEDPELLKVKEALMNDELEDEDDEEEDEEEYEYDFDQLQMEYEEDKKRGMVSRQDSGVSGRSGDAAVSRGHSFEEEHGHLHGRAHSVQAEMKINDHINRRESFERAQSEVAQPSSRRAAFAGGSGGSASGSGLFLHDRFTDYIAMKAANRNQRVGSSLRSLNNSASSRYSSSEQLQQQQQVQASASLGAGEQLSRDSGRSSMHQETPPSGEPKQAFRVRSFNMEDELEGIERLERSVSKPTFRTTYDILSPQGGRPLAGFSHNSNWRGVSAPDLGGGGGSGHHQGGQREEEEGSSSEFWGRTRTLEHSRSERFDGVDVPDSGLMARGIEMGGYFAPGGLDAGEDEEEESVETSEGVSLDIGLDRDVPREREIGLQRGLWHQQRDSLSEVEQALESVEEGEEEEEEEQALVFGEMEGDVRLDNEYHHEEGEQLFPEHMGEEDAPSFDQIDLDSIPPGGWNEGMVGAGVDEEVSKVDEFGYGFGEDSLHERPVGQEDDVEEVEQEPDDEPVVRDVHEEFQEINLEKPYPTRSFDQEHLDSIPPGGWNDGMVGAGVDEGVSKVDEFGYGLEHEYEGEDLRGAGEIESELGVMLMGFGEDHLHEQPVGHEFGGDEEQEHEEQQLQEIDLEMPNRLSSTEFTGEVEVEGEWDDSINPVEEPQDESDQCELRGMELRRSESLGGMGGDLKRSQFEDVAGLEEQELVTADFEQQQSEELCDVHEEQRFQRIDLAEPDHFTSGGLGMELETGLHEAASPVEEDETNLTFDMKQLQYSEGLAAIGGDSQQIVEEVDPEEQDLVAREFEAEAEELLDVPEEQELQEIDLAKPGSSEMELEFGLDETDPHATNLAVQDDEGLGVEQGSDLEEQEQVIPDFEQQQQQHQAASPDVQARTDLDEHDGWGVLDRLSASELLDMCEADKYADEEHLGVQVLTSDVSGEAEKQGEPRQLEAGGVILANESDCQEQHGQKDPVGSDLRQPVNAVLSEEISDNPTGPKVEDNPEVSSSRERRRNLVSLGLGGVSGCTQSEASGQFTIASTSNNIPVTRGDVRAPSSVVPLGSVEVQHETTVIDLVEGTLDIEILTTPKRSDNKTDFYNASLTRRSFAPYASAAGYEDRPEKKRQKTQRSRPTSLAELSELSPVTEEQSRSSSSLRRTTMYAPDMKAYDRISTRSRRSTTRETTPLVDLITKLSSGPTATTASATVTPVALSEIQENLRLLKNPPSPQPPPEAVPSSPAAEPSEARRGGVTAAKEEVEEETTESASGLMRYVCVVAFYLILSPVVLFVDDLYVALLWLLLVASVHYFFITF